MFGPFGALLLEGECLCASLRLVAHFFQAVSALPKEQIGRDGCAQDGHQECQIGFVELEVGDNCVGEHAAPLMGDEDSHHEIGQKRGAQDLEDEGDAGEGAEHQQRRDEGTRQKRPEPGRAGVEELHARPDGHQVGGDVQGVGHDESDQEHCQDRSAGAVETLDGQLAQSGACRQGRAVTNLLNANHQWQRQQGGPQERQPVFGPGLGVGGDPRGVVVGRPGDQARSHGPQVLTPDRPGARLREIEFGCPRGGRRSGDVSRR